MVEYSTAGVQTNLAVTGLASPTTVTYDSASGSLFILDSTLGGVIQFNLSTHTQTTIFSGVTGLDPALAVDGSGGIYYAVGDTVMFRAPNGTTSPVYTEDNAGPLAPHSPYSEQITGLAFDAVHQSLWFGTTLWFGSGMAFELLDSRHHASFVGFDSADYGQLSLDPPAPLTPRGSCSPTIR